MSQQPVCQVRRAACFTEQADEVRLQPLRIERCRNRRSVQALGRPAFLAATVIESAPAETRHHPPHLIHTGRERAISSTTMYSRIRGEQSTRTATTGGRMQPESCRGLDQRQHPGVIRSAPLPLEHGERLCPGIPFCQRAGGMGGYSASGLARRQAGTEVVPAVVSRRRPSRA